MTDSSGKNPERKTPPHLSTKKRTNLSPVIFLTVCAKDRKKILAREDVHELLLQAWYDSDSWMVGRYVVLPDHIHLFCSPRTDCRIPLASWVRRWKSFCSKSWPRDGEKPVWQNSFWDRQLRSSENYSNKWKYVRENPVRHHLVKSYDLWKYQGQIYQLQM